jgi:hypothetical protein
MEVSKKQKRVVRRAVLTAESLEGRQLLSGSTATTPAASPVAVGTTAADPTGTSAPMRHVRFGRGHFGASGSKGSLSHAGGAAGQRATLASMDASSTGTASTSTTGAATSAALTPVPGGRMQGFARGISQQSPAMGSRAGFSTVAQAGAATRFQSLSQGGPLGVMKFGGGSSGGGFGGMGMGQSNFFGRGRAMGGGPVGWGNAVAAGSTSTGTSTSATPSPVGTAIKQLKTDEQAIADKSQVTPALQAALRTDLQTLNKAATTAPDSTKLLALNSDLQSLAGTLPTSDQLTTLQTDFTAVVNSQGVTDSATITKTFTDLNALITATNIGASDITTLTTDLKAAGRSTTAPLGSLGIDLNVLGQAVNPYAGSTTTAAAPPTATTTTTAAASSGTTTTSTSTTS